MGGRGGGASGEGREKPEIKGEEGEGVAVLEPLGASGGGVTRADDDAPAVLSLLSSSVLSGDGVCGAAIPLAFFPFFVMVVAWGVNEL